ncbi:MAG: glycoside hydrolase family 2 protein [Clostridiales bacterium]|nr:glycoside hydrolase family 2 protein [Clostridiales bacterium]
MRQILDFNAQWRFAKGAAIPSTLPENWETVTLPHTWNAEDGQDGGNDYWRGTGIYAKAFPRPEADCVYIEFQGAAMTADVWLNGVKLCRHEGGYSTFRADMTPFLQEDNLLCVAVDNSANDRVYPQKADFTFYGGLYRDVSLICVPAQHFELLKDGTPGIRTSSRIEGKDALVTIETWQNEDVPVTITLDGQTVQANSQNGHARAEVRIPQVHLWDGINDPWLYTVIASLPSGDQISTRMGCRSIRVDPDAGFFLNGRPYPLRGVSRHQDRAGIGNALTCQHHREDLSIIREMGANTVRLAHYQQAQAVYDLCDELGLIVWAEIPYISQHMPGGRENTLQQMREMITQCHHHPSIVCWGLSNEISAGSPVTEDLLENHRQLNELCHRMDPDRLTTMAHVFMLETDSPLTQISDIGSYNLYFGWYLGELTQNDDFFDKYHREYPHRAIGLAEYGADANPAYQSASPERGDYSETYQCVYHEHLLKMIEDRPWLWATHVWNMFDFAADGRDEGGKHGVNQKGLVTMDRKIRKDAFYLYKAAWSTDPFVHLCGKRYEKRSETETDIIVYSNQSEVTLYVDGRLHGTQQGKTRFAWRIPLSASHTVEAVSGGSRDRMTICRVEGPVAAYRMQVAQTVVNWFDQDTFDPNCYSIRDKMGVLLQDPRTSAIVGRLMQQARKRRGDVAEATSGNAMLQRMMAEMTLESLLKQAGDSISAEAVLELNAALQKIPKTAM